MQPKHIFEYRGCYIYQYGRWMNQYKIQVNDQATRIKLINTNTDEEIKGIKNILKYVKMHDLEIKNA